MKNGAETEPTSTVFALSDQVLLAQTRELARVEQALQITVLDHLREIDARRLHLRRGYSSLFDYPVIGFISFTINTLRDAIFFRYRRNAEFGISSIISKKNKCRSLTVTCFHPNR